MSRTVFQSTKTYGHDVGLSCCFRQWRATHSHCSLLHGYALAFRFVFEAEELDARNWVADFGALKPLKAVLQEKFDHTLLVAEDDPKRSVLEELDTKHGLAKVVIVEAAGCERTAELAYHMADGWINDQGLADRVRIVSVEVSEHPSNSAIYISKD